MAAFILIPKGTSRCASRFKEIIYRQEDNGIVCRYAEHRNEERDQPYTCTNCSGPSTRWWKRTGGPGDDLTGAKDPDNDDPAKEAFCSGGYFNPNAMAGVSDEIKADIDMTDIAQARLTIKMWQCDKPIIAAVNGLFIGGGFTMCLAGCDLIYCSEHAWAQLPFIGLGIIPELASSYLLPRLIGFQRAKEIMFFGDRIPARSFSRWESSTRFCPTTS